MSPEHKALLTTAFDALGPERVRRGLTAAGHSWSDCFLATQGQATSRSMLNSTSMTRTSWPSWATWWRRPRQVAPRGHFTANLFRWHWPLMLQLVTRSKPAAQRRWSTGFRVRNFGR